jgi:ubiquinone/menaquinone biosynthesis C-methylase UbiE
MQVAGDRGGIIAFAAAAGTLSQPERWSATMPSHTRYDRVASSYSQYRPRYPDVLIAHLADTIVRTGATGPVFDIGSGTGAFTRQLRPALPASVPLVGVEPSRGMLAQAVAETAATPGIAFIAGLAETLPLRDRSAGAITAATAAHWFDRPAFYRESRRALAPGGVLAIVEYARDATDPLAAALIAFMARYGSRHAYAAPDYQRELAGLDGFGDLDNYVLPRRLELQSEQFVGLALSFSHAAGLVKRFGETGARDALRALAAPHRCGDDRVPFGYRFTCLTVRRNP